ncbi:M14 family metallopeptidase [Caldisericum sp. AR60]|uniref:M14 family metallopeptidase n=1 Tax=Caldisericum sp. AR60 TaxID=3397852 RepID=UPI0039FD448F
MKEKIIFDYESAKKRFRAHFEEFKRKFSDVAIESIPIDENDNLFIDIIRIFKDKPKTLIFTIGEHGVEGIFGSFIMEVFIQEILPMLNLEDTSIILVHPINPFGMKYLERTNKNNVDLNRNFLNSWDNIFKNTAYLSLRDVFEKSGSVENLVVERIKYYKDVLKILIQGKTKLVKNTLLIGQYESPNGLYYGGKDYEKETLLMIKLFENAFKISKQVVHIDIHTGYGPKDTMSVVNSHLFVEDSKTFEKEINYSPVVKSENSEFYSMSGDMIDYLYTLRNEKFRDTKLYSASFEFGILGDSILNEIEALFRAIINNRLRFYGSKNDKIKQYVKKLYLEAFCPTSEESVKKMYSQFKRAILGILKKEGLISNKNL